MSAIKVGDTFRATIRGSKYSKAVGLHEYDANNRPIILIKREEQCGKDLGVHVATAVSGRGQFVSTIDRTFNKKWFILTKE